MITSIGLENIRIFRNKSNFDLSKINVLTGVNASGKSSLQKILLLLSQGLKHRNKGRLDLSSIELDNEVIKFIGDIRSNINYDNQEEGMKIYFTFETDLFGEIEAKLTYLPTKNNYQAYLSEISFMKKEKIFMRYFTNNIYDFQKEQEENGNIYNLKEISEQYFWQIDTDYVDSYVDLLYCSILKKVESCYRQENLLKANEILLNSDGDESKLCRESYDIYNIYKSNGFEYSPDLPKHSFARIDSSVEFNWCIWNPQTCTMPSYSSSKVEFLNTFHSTGQNFLFKTPIIKMVYGDHIFTQKPEGNEVFESLVRLGISDVDSFEKAYMSFEKNLIRKKILEETHGLSQTITINSKGNKINMHYATPFHDYFQQKDYSFGNHKEVDCLDLDSPIFEGDRIAMLLKEHNLLDDSVTVLQYITSNVNYIKNQQKVLIEVLSDKIENLIHDFRFSVYEKGFNRYYFLNDQSVLDSPLLKLGIEYLKALKDPFNQRHFFKRKNRIDLWLRTFEIAESFDLELLKAGDEVIGFAYYFNENSHRSPLGDYGRGINHLFQVIIQIVESTDKSTVVIEEPEVNLHPAYQSKLADLFISTRGKLIVETHSEYLIRKLQLNIAQNKVNHDDISLYYISKDISKERQQVEKIEITKDGMLNKEFGPGFFDESSKLSYNLLTL